MKRYENILHCEKCENTNIHHFKVSSFFRDEEDSITGINCTIESSKESEKFNKRNPVLTVTGDAETENPSTRSLQAISRSTFTPKRISACRKRSPRRL